MKLDTLITPKKLNEWGACSDGKKWGNSIIGKGMTIEKLLPKFERSDWLIWTLKRSVDLTKVQYVELAVICAKTVLAIYEKKYPKDDRPKKAIEAAIEYAKDPSEENRKAAAAAAAADSAAVAYAAAAAVAAAAVADAYADAYATYAAAYATYAAVAAVAAVAAYATYAADAAAYATYAAAQKKHHIKMCKLIRAQLKKWMLEGKGVMK